MSTKSVAARRAAAAALRTAGERLDALLHLSEEDVDEMVDEFDRLRKGSDDGYGWPQMTRTIEGVRIYRGPEGDPAGVLRRFVGDTGVESEIALQRCKDLLIAATHWIPARPPTLDDWRARLPAWFIAACAPEPTEAETAENLRAWRALDSAGRARYEAEQPWTLENWLAWFGWDSDLQRSWRWWDGGTIDNAAFWIEVEMLDDPGAIGSLLWMMRAAGARSVVEVDHPVG